MKEKKEVRISRLEGRKGRVNEQINKLKSSNTRNKDFKISRLTDQRVAIESKLEEMKR